MYRSKTKITAEVIESAKKLKTICCFCIGTDQVDLEAASKSGIPVFNSPYANGLSVAELIIAEIIALSRNLTDVNASVHAGSWSKTAIGNHEIRGKTLGIIGFGNIGMKVANFASAMGMKVQYYDTVSKVHTPIAEPVPFDDLLRTSDFVTIHVPGANEVKNMIAEPQLSLMKNGSYLLNASRGCVVDIGALASHIKSKHLAGAAIDVYPREPESNSQVFQTELSGLKNVILTPHIGGSTEEAQVAVAVEVTHSVVQYLQRGSIINSVNFHTVTFAPPLPGTARITSRHVNFPGVLKNINEKLSEYNVIKQYSAAMGCVAYAVIDVEFSSDSLENLLNCVEEIDGIPGCLSTYKMLADRVLL